LLGKERKSLPIVAAIVAHHHRPASIGLAKFLVACSSAIQTNAQATRVEQSNQIEDRSSNGGDDEPDQRLSYPFMQHTNGQKKQPATKRSINCRNNNSNRRFALALIANHTTRSACHHQISKRNDVTRQTLFDSAHNNTDNHIQSSNISPNFKQPRNNDGFLITATPMDDHKSVGS